MKIAQQHINPSGIVHPGIAWLQRCEAKIYLVRAGEEAVDKAIMDLAQAFYELVHPACDCSRDISERMERLYPPVPPKSKRRRVA